MEAFLANGETIREVARRYKLSETTAQQWIRQASDEALQIASAGPGRDAIRESPANAVSVRHQAQALAMFGSGGKTIAEIACTLGLPEPTVREWIWHAPLNAVPEVLESEFREVQADRAGQLAGGEAQAAAKAQIQSALVEATEAAARAKAAEAAALAKAEKAEANASKVAKALQRAEKKAAAAVARANAATEAEKAARAEIATAYAAAVGIIVRTEVEAAERIASLEAVAAAAAAEAQVATAAAQAEVAARVEAEEAARAETAVIYAEAVEAIVRAEVEAAERMAVVEAAAADAVAQAQSAAAEAQAIAADAVGRSESLAEASARLETALAEVEALLQAEVAARVEAEKAQREVAVAYAAALETRVRAEFEAADKLAGFDAAADAAATQAPARARFEVDPDEQFGATADDETTARAEIAQLLSHLDPVTVWVQVVGRTVEEAREAALDALGVDGANAEIEVLEKGSLWRPGRARVRARIRVTDGQA